jgi:hypothetical protein
MYWDPTNQTPAGCMAMPSKKDLASITEWSAQFDPAMDPEVLLDGRVTRVNLVGALLFTSIDFPCINRFRFSSELVMGGVVTLYIVGNNSPYIFPQWLTWFRSIVSGHALQTFPDNSFACMYLIYIEYSAADNLWNLLVLPMDCIEGNRINGERGLGAKVGTVILRSCLVRSLTFML